MLMVRGVHEMYTETLADVSYPAAAMAECSEVQRYAFICCPLIIHALSAVARLVVQRYAVSGCTLVYMHCQQLPAHSSPAVYSQLLTAFIVNALPSVARL